MRETERKTMRKPGASSLWRLVPEDVRNFIDILKGEGYEACVVGGCVRDMILGREPSDFDVTTSALPEDTVRILESKGVKTFGTGLKHGTVTALSGAGPVEITTYRVDGEYKDNRHPEKVRFTSSLRDDLSRRDFTINAMALGEDGVKDYFGGTDDLEKGIIRAVGDGEKRFREDGLRIMRALRFAATYGFELDEKTSEAVLSCRKLLENISRERIYSEFTRLICGKGAGGILRKYREVFFEIIPELEICSGFDQRSSFHLYDVYEHMVRAMENVRPEPVIRMAALFHDIGKPDCFTLGDDGEGHFYGHAEIGEEKAGEILARLKSDGETRRRVKLLVKNHHRQVEDTDKAIRRALGKLGEEQFFTLLELKRADGIATGKPSEDEGRHWLKVEKRAKDIIDRKDCVSKKQLAVSGRDLMEAGIPQGRVMGRILDELLEEVLDGRIRNDKEELLKEAAVLYNICG